MATSIDGPRIATHHQHLSDPPPDHIGARVIPVAAAAAAATATTPNITMSAPSDHGDPMEGTSPTSDSNGGHDRNHDRNDDRSRNDHAASEQQQQQHNNGNGTSSNSMLAPPSTSSASSVQTKVVQTAFIHKLYSMLEDSTISHLISWSEAGDSFVMSPSTDFSKVLSQYFKHTNISSFVRQLNMYGFHKERDVFHTGHPESTLWEFKHGNGSFKRGDLIGLREIKRRASRHALVHRENQFPKTSASLPGTPAEPIPIVPTEGPDSRLATHEHTIYDLSARLQRSEESAHYMHVRAQAMTETLGRMLHFNSELSRTLLSLFSPDSQQYRDVLNIQGEFQREADALKSHDPHHEAYAGRQQYYAGIENAPVSPRQMAQDARPTNLAPPPPASRGPPMYRPPLTSHVSTGSRRPYGSISGGATSIGNPATQSSPLRNTTNAPPPERHPLSNVELPGSLARRHTSADIREHGWPPGAHHSQYPPSNPPSAHWPSSPGRGGPEVQGIRDSLATYTLQPSAPMAPENSRPTTPPPPPFQQQHGGGANGGGGGGGDTFGNWNWGSATREKLGVKPESSAPTTRRGSMAHILNPSDTAERSDEDEDHRGENDSKRQRMG